MNKFIKNVTIKQLLLVIPVLIIVAFIYLFTSISININKLEDKSKKATLANRIIKLMLDARINEKNYIIFKEEKYADEVESLVGKSLKIADRLQKMFKDPENDKLVENVKTNIKQYITLFNEYKNIREKSYKVLDDMERDANSIENIAIKIRKIQRKQRDEVIKTSKNPQRILDEVEEASLANKIVKELLITRLNEQKYIRTKDEKFAKIIEESLKRIRKLALHLKSILDSPKNKRMVDELLKNLNQYENSLKEFVSLKEKSQQVLLKMRKEAREAEDSLISLRKDQKKERAQILAELKREMLIAFIIVAIVLISLTLYISRLIRASLEKIEKAAEDLAMGEGDLTKRIEINGNNEISIVAHNINKFIEKVQNAIIEAKNVSNEAASISNELSATSIQIGDNVEKEAELVKSVNEDTTNTSKEAEFVDNKVVELQKISEKSFKMLNEATQRINELVKIVKEASNKEEMLAERMLKLKESTSDIKDILALIGEIAKQTNLLALNAAIEAARAGENGKGFAVVADEVRNLAERTEKSLSEIEEIINELIKSIEEATDQMQKNAEEISNAAEYATEVEDNVDHVINAMEESKQMAEESSNAVNKLKEDIISISKKMEKLNETASLNARSVEEIAAAAEHLNKVIEKLNKQLNGFKS